MKNFTLFVTLAFVFNLGVLSAQNIEPTIRNGVINRLTLFSETPVYDYSTLSYNYDAVLVIIRTVENRSKSSGDNFDALEYKCFAEARFFDRESKGHISVDSVVVNGLKLTPRQFGNANYYFTTDNYLYPVSAITPNIRWSVFGANSVPNFNGDSLASVLKFPDFYYINSYSENAIIDGKDDWSMSVSKWNKGSNSVLPKPDLIRGWILSLAGSPASPLANFSSIIKNDNVTAETYSGIIEGIYNTFDSKSVLPGQGCAVVRTYKLYPVKVLNPSTGKKFDWLFIMGVESEVPVNFR